MTEIKETEHWTMGPEEVKKDYVEVIYTEPNDFEKSLLKGTMKPEVLIEIEKTEKIEKDRRKEYITQVKCYALTKIGKKPLDNPSTFNQETKIKLMETMDEIIKTMTEEQIKIEFETAINLHVFKDISMDYSTLHK
jgi:hypothetical protein